MHRARTRELAAPPIAAEGGAFEVLRAWTKEGGPNQVMLHTTWSDPFLWGMFLVDIARHAAKAYGDGDAPAEAKALRRIHDGFEAEWNHPTDTPIRLQ